MYTGQMLLFIKIYYITLKVPLNTFNKISDFAYGPPKVKKFFVRKGYDYLCMTNIYLYICMILFISKLRIYTELILDVFHMQYMYMFLFFYQGKSKIFFSCITLVLSMVILILNLLQDPRTNNSFSTRTFGI